MKVLILTQYFAPEPIDKVIDEAVSLKERGHEVEVLTGFPCYPQGKIYDGYRQKLLQRDVYRGVPVIRVPQFADHSQSAIRRAFYYLSFACSAMFIGAWNVRRADVMLVYQSALPTGIAAWWIRLVRGIPYMLDVVDLWPESVVASGFLRNRFCVWLIRTCARFVYSQADHISVITTGYRDRLLDMGVSAHKISVIHHWKRPDFDGPIVADDTISQDQDLSRSFIVMYAGNIGPCQSLETVLRCAEQLKTSTPDVNFVFIGDGVDFQRLQRLATERNVTNVRFLGRRQPEQVAFLTERADAMLVHLERSPMADVSIPSKTISYLASGKPILMGVAGEASRLIQQYECGLTFEPQDPASLADAVLAMFHASEEQRLNWSRASLAAFRDNFVPQVQMDKVVTELSKVAQRFAA